MWKDLTIGQKSEVMRLAVQQGFSDLNNIKEMYNAATSVYNTSSNNTYDNVPYNPSPKDVRYDDGGWLDYLKWKDAIGKYKGIDTDDPAYDYAGFYIENPKRAWALLDGNPNAHFVDTYKTVYHPTFSDESMYSGMVSPQYNPEGLIGGSWRKYPNSFTMSTDLYKSPVSMDERIQYLENNEPEGIVLREYDGSLPMFNDGSLWGGVKPTVEVSPYAYGGPLGNIYKGTGNKSQKLSKAERENRAMWAKGQPFYKEMRLWNTGLSDVALAGILGNMGLESGFIPTASNGTHHGYLQNENSIRDYIVKYYGGYGHKQQMQYLQDGLRGKLRGSSTSMGKQLQRRFSNYTSAVKNVTDPIKASQLWEKYYEISGGQAMGARQRYAKHFYDQMSASGPGAFRRAKLDGTLSPIKNEKYTAYEPSINVESPVFHTAANDLQWQPSIVASSKQEDIAPLLVQDNKPLIVEPLEGTSSTPKDFSAIWDQIFPKIENTQEEFNPLLDPSTQFTALQSRPRYQMKSTPIINMPISSGDNDYMLFKPLAKGGRIKGKTNDGSRDIQYNPYFKRWTWGSKNALLPLGHRIKMNDGYEYQLNSDGTKTRIGKIPSEEDQKVTRVLHDSPSNNVFDATMDLITSAATGEKQYYNGLYPYLQDKMIMGAPLYAARTGNMSYLPNDDTHINTNTTTNNPLLPRKLGTFYDLDTLYLPKGYEDYTQVLSGGISINKDNVKENKITRLGYPTYDARNHDMQLRVSDNGYLTDFSDVFDTNNSYFDSKLNPIIFSQYNIPTQFTNDTTLINTNKTLADEIGYSIGRQLPNIFAESYLNNAIKDIQEKYK